MTFLIPRTPCPGFAGLFSSGASLSRSDCRQHQRQPVSFHSRRPAGVEIGGLNLVLFEPRPSSRPLDAFELPVDALAPPPEVVRTTANLLLPRATGVRCERKVGVGFWRADGFPRTRFPARLGHAAPPARVWCRRLRRLHTSEATILPEACW